MEPTPELLLGGFGFTKGSLQRVAGAYAKVFCRGSSSLNLKGFFAGGCKAHKVGVGR